MPPRTEPERLAPKAAPFTVGKLKKAFWLLLTCGSLSLFGCATGSRDLVDAPYYDDHYREREELLRMRDKANRMTKEAVSDPDHYRGDRYFN